MVTLDRFLKMRKADEKELEKIINDLSEADAKAYLRLLIAEINKHWDADLESFLKGEE